MLSGYDIRLPLRIGPRRLVSEAAMRQNPYEISKTFSFDAAHFLPRVPEGHKCKRMHGHTYLVTVSLKRDELEDAGWVLDYGELSRLVKPLIERLDHTTLNEIEGLENPTAEQIAHWLYDRLLGNVPFLDAVEVKETPATAARYRRNPAEPSFCRVKTLFERYQDENWGRFEPGLTPLEFYTQFLSVSAREVEEASSEDERASIKVEFGMAASERDFFMNFCPTVRVYPSILTALEATRLDVECQYLRLPFPVFALSLPVGDSICHVLALLVGAKDEESGHASFVAEDQSDARRLWAFVVFPDGHFEVHDLELAHGRTVSDIIDDTVGAEQADHARRVMSLVIGASFLAIGQMKSKRTDQPVVEEERPPRRERRRMEKLTGEDFDQPIIVIGRNLEHEIRLPRQEPTDRRDQQTEEGHEIAYGYLRSGHLRWQMRGPHEGPNDYVLTFVRPHMVRPDLPIRAKKTPYGARRPRGETTEVDIRRLEPNPPHDDAFSVVERILDGDLRAAAELAQVKLPISLSLLVDDVVALAVNMDAESARFTNTVLARERGEVSEAQMEAARSQFHRADRALRKAAKELRRQVAPESTPPVKLRVRPFSAPGAGRPQPMPLGRFVPIGTGSQRRKLGVKRLNGDEALRRLERDAEHDPAARDALSVAMIRAGKGEVRDHAFWSVRVLDRNRKTIYETTLVRSEEPFDAGPKLPILWSTTRRLVVTAPEGVRDRILRRGNWIVYWKSERLRDGRHAVIQGQPHTHLLAATGAPPMSDGSMSPQAVNWGRPDRKILKNY